MLVGKYEFFSTIRSIYRIEIAKVINFWYLRRLLAPQANIFVQILVNFGKKSTKMFLFVKNTKFFARAKARGLFISLSSYNNLIYQTNNSIPTNIISIKKTVNFMIDS